MVVLIHSVWFIKFIEILIEIDFVPPNFFNYQDCSNVIHVKFEQRLLIETMERNMFSFN